MKAQSSTGIQWTWKQNTWDLRILNTYPEQFWQLEGLLSACASQNIVQRFVLKMINIEQPPLPAPTYNPIPKYFMRL
jgi:hypothetical protein